MPSGTIFLDWMVTIPRSKAEEALPGNPQETFAGFSHNFGGDRLLDVKKIPLKIGYYLAGFADGEGSFIVTLRPRKDYKLKWKVSVVFNVANKDKVVLALFKRYLRCGSLRQRKDGIWYYEVNNFRSIVENVIPFFERFKFLSAKKKRDFSKFRSIVELMQNKEHLTKEGLEKILALRAQMNDGGKRRYEATTLGELREGSSEAIRRAPHEHDP